MFKKFKRFIQDKGLIKEVLNIIMGILTVVALLVYSITKNVYSLCAVIILGAMINIINGLALIKRKEKRSFGLSMILLGIVILVIFAIFTANGYISVGD